MYSMGVSAFGVASQESWLFKELSMVFSYQSREYTAGCARESLTYHSVSGIVQYYSRGARS